MQANDKRIKMLEEALARATVELAKAAEENQQLRAEVERLKERLGQNSSNSSKPPSSDPPDKKKKNKDKKKRRRRDRNSTRKRGGQKGHKGHHRKLLDKSQVDAFVDLFPTQCVNCWKPLPEVLDPGAKRHQVTEIPPIKPHTTEYRRHKVQCACCGHRTRAKQDGRIPKTSFGPRLESILALLTGVYHLSRRQAQRAASDLFGVRISLGALSQMEGRVSTATKPLVDEAWAHAQNAKVKHTDGTSWKQSGIAMQLWTIATVAVTVFKIIADGSKKTLQPLFGEIVGTLISDRAASLNFWAMEARQICWAHLLRKFISFSERDGTAGRYGRELVDSCGIMFDYWHSYKNGRLSWEAMQHRMAPLCRHVEKLFEKIDAADIARMSGSCRNILAHRDALWTFIQELNVEPTNNHAERELRAFVLWRRRSFGTQSARGNEFAENIMTVAHTARKQKLNVLTLLTECCRARLAGTRPPSLLG